MNYLTISQISQNFSVSKAAIFRWYKSGEYPGAIKKSGSILIPEGDIWDFKKRREEKLGKIPPGYLTVQETADKFSVNPITVTHWIKNGIFPNSIKFQIHLTRKSWLIPDNDIIEWSNTPRYKSILDHVDGNKKFVTSLQAADRLGVATHTIHDWCQKRLFIGAKFKAGAWMIPEEQIALHDQDSSKYLSLAEAEKALELSFMQIHKEIVRGELRARRTTTLEYQLLKVDVDDYLQKQAEFRKYLSLKAASERLPFNLSTLQGWVKKNIISYVVFQGKILIDPLFVKRFEGVYDSIYIAQKENSTIGGIVARINRGQFPNAFKWQRIWFIPHEDYDNWKKAHPNTLELNDAFEYFDIKYQQLQSKNSPKTLAIFRLFFLEEYRKSNFKNKKKFAQSYVYTIKTVNEALEKELYTYNDHEVELFIRNDNFKSLTINIVVKFVYYCARINKELCQYNPEKIKLKTVGNLLPKPCYSEKQFGNFIRYSQDIEKHIRVAIYDRDYAASWLFVLFHTTNAWRASDVLKIPNVNPEAVGIELLDWFNSNRMTQAQSRHIINQIYFWREQLLTNKTNALLQFICNLDMEIPLATSLVIAELHRRNVQGESLLEPLSSENRNSNYQWKVARFLKNSRLPGFLSIKMNRSFLTYLHHVVTESEFTDIALVMAKASRSHMNDNSTALYIQTQNADGHIDNCAEYLLRRGSFGWNYEIIINLCCNNQLLKLSQYEKTAKIEAMKKQINTIEIERLAAFFVQQKIRESIISDLYKKKHSEIQELALKVFRKEMPAAEPDAQCLLFPNCVAPNTNSCSQCAYVIPNLYLLVAISNTVQDIISRIIVTHAKDKAELIKLNSLLLKNLDVISQAIKAFGTDYTSAFVNINKLRNQLDELNRTERLIFELKN